MVQDIEGYTNSQTWEAWRDSINVLWDNTEIIFLLSITVSIGAVIYTWIHCPTTDDHKMNSEERRGIPEGSDQALIRYNESEQEDTEELLDENGSLASNPKKLVQEIEKRMSEDDKAKEKEAQNEQLSAIFKLMQEQKEKFGDTSLGEIQDQMRFYCR